MKRGEKIAWFSLSMLFLVLFLFGITDAALGTFLTRHFVVFALLVLLYCTCFFLWLLRRFKERSH